MAKKHGGAGARKHGRAARKPKTARRKMRRPDLERKFRKTLKSCGKEFTLAWLRQMFDKGEPVSKYFDKLR